MASFLMIRDLPNTKFNTLSKAAQSKKSICVYKNSFHDSFLKESKLDFHNVIRTGSENDAIQGVLDGECDIALSSYQNLDIFHRKKETVDDSQPKNRCDVARGGQILEHMGGGLGVAIDSGRYCTSLISHVVDLHLQEMEEEGVLNDIIEQTRLSIGTPKCFENESKEEKPESLAMHDMFGIFSMHAICCSISLCLGLGFRYKNHVAFKAESKVSGMFDSKKSQFIENEATKRSLAGPASEKSILRKRKHRNTAVVSFSNVVSDDYNVNLTPFRAKSIWRRSG
jgi:hypothetical protein